MGKLKLFIFMLVISINLSGCFKSPNVKNIDSKDGEEIVVLKEREKNKDREISQRYTNDLNEIVHKHNDKISINSVRDWVRAILK